MRGPGSNHPYRDKVTGHMKHPTPLMLTTPSMRPRRRSYARRDALLRECMELEEHYKATPLPELLVKIIKLRGEIDYRQQKINKNFSKGASYLPR